MATTVYLVRHGSVVGAETRRFIGHLDVPLSPLGEQQMTRLASRLHMVALDAVYASDLERARRSAEILAAPHGLHPVAVPALREFAMGRWEGLTADQIRELDAVAFSTWMADVPGYQFPEGESLTHLAARAWPAFERIVAAHANGSVAVVAHGGTNRMILCRALGLGDGRLLAFGQDYAGLTVLRRSGGRWTLGRLNDGGERGGWGAYATRAPEISLPLDGARRVSDTAPQIAQARPARGCTEAHRHRAADLRHPRASVRPDPSHVVLHAPRALQVCDRLEIWALRVHLDPGSGAQGDRVTGWACLHTRASAWRPVGAERSCQRPPARRGRCEVFAGTGAQEIALRQPARARRRHRGA